MRFSKFFLLKLGSNVWKAEAAGVSAGKLCGGAALAAVRRTHKARLQLSGQAVGLAVKRCCRSEFRALTFLGMYRRVAVLGYVQQSLP